MGVEGPNLGSGNNPHAGAGPQPILGNSMQESDLSHKTRGSTNVNPGMVSDERHSWFSGTSSRGGRGLQLLHTSPLLCFHLSNRQAHKNGKSPENHLLG